MKKRKTWNEARGGDWQGERERGRERERERGRERERRRDHSDLDSHRRPVMSHERANALAAAEEELLTRSSCYTTALFTPDNWGNNSNGDEACSGCCGDWGWAVA